MPVTTVLERVRALLDAGDVRGAVILLNSLTPHRFTSLFRFDGDMLRNVVFFDRENPSEEAVEDVPVAASYCVFVRDSAGTFTVPDAACDARVDGHPKQPVFRSYCGVPLVDSTGRMFGTICHFDFEPRAVDPKTVELLEAVAPYLPPSAERPGA
jgi:GAF domain-containing protein